MKETIQYTGISVTSALSAFIYDSLALISIWLWVILWVTIADLLASLYKCYKIGQEIRFSRGCRDTMIKLSAYFAFVVASVFSSGASGNMDMARWCCLFILVVEGASIVSNILKAHGYALNVNAVINLILSHFGWESKENLIEKDNGRN